jgi:hypothetical protein
MKCPECGSRAYSVADKRDDYDANVTTRRRWCGNAECGARWNTTERQDRGQTITFMKRTQSIERRQSPSIALRAAQQTAKDEHSRQDKSGQQTGFSPSVSDLDPISFRSSQLPDPDRSKQTKLRVDRARGLGRKKGEPFKFTPEFLTFWFAIESNRAKGSKAEAFRRWTEEKAPGAAPLIAKWREFMASLGDTFAPDVCRWIARRGWEEEYESAPARAAKPAVADPRCTWHRDPRNDSRASSYPKPGCPRCKHFAARNGTRSGEPSEIGELAARKAAELEAESERKRLAAAERFRQERERDTKASNGGTT